MLLLIKHCISVVFKESSKIIIIDHGILVGQSDMRTLRDEGP